MDQKMRSKTMFFVRWSIFCIVMLMSLSSIAFAADTTKVYVGANEVKFKQSTYKENGKIWVEVSSIVPKLGGKYFWNKAKSKLTIVSGSGNSVSYFVGQKKAFYGNQTEEISFAPVLKGGQVMMPLDAVAQNCNQAYKIDEANGSMYLFDMDRLVMDTLLEKKVIKDEFYYISDWWYEGPDLIMYELRRNTFSEGTASLVDRYSYQLSTGELHKLIFESEKKELVGKYPVNSQTAEKYKSNGWIKFDLFTEEYGVVADILILNTIKSRGYQKENLLVDNMSAEERGYVMYQIIQFDAYTNQHKSKLVSRQEKSDDMKINPKKINEISTLVLGGPADLKEFSDPSNKNILKWYDAIEIDQVMLKYKKIEGNKLWLKGDIVNTDREDSHKITANQGSFTVALEKNQKSPVGYVLKSMDYMPNKG